MKAACWRPAVIALASAGLVMAVPADAKPVHKSSGHGHCLRFNKTTGAVAGGVGGAILGKAILGGTGGLLVGAAAGGLAGHHFAHNRKKRCR